MNNKNSGLLTLLLVMGVLNSVMVFINGVLAKYTDLYMAGLIVHLIGFFPALVMFLMFDKSKLPAWAITFNKDKRLFVSGFIGSVLLIISAYCINISGVFITSIAMVAGQFALSVVVDIKGLFGFEKVKLGYRKLSAIGLIILGILLISM